MTKKNHSLDSVLEEFDVSSFKTEPTPTKPICFWIPLEYKEKYDMIQQRTKQRFGRALIEVIRRSIEKVEIDTEAG